MVWIRALLQESRRDRQEFDIVAAVQMTWADQNLPGLIAQMLRYESSPFLAMRKTDSNQSGRQGR